MERWPWAPVRAIKIECILPDSTVIAHEAFLVDIREIALVTRVAGEIEQVPDEHTPEIGARPQSTPRRLVIEVLHLFRVGPAMRIDGTAGGIVTVLGERRPRAIFRDGQWQPRVTRMRGVEHHAEVAELAGIP